MIRSIFLIIFLPDTTTDFSVRNYQPIFVHSRYGKE